MTTEVMEEAVRVQFTDERPVVSARDLHKALEIRTLFRQWFPRMCEYGFCEGTDYDKVYQKCDGSRTGQVEVDYLISTDMAKHICMIQRTKKGMMYRQYFLELEKAWNTPEKVMARALQRRSARNGCWQKSNRRRITWTGSCIQRRWCSRRRSPRITG